MKKDRPHRRDGGGGGVTALLSNPGTKADAGSEQRYLQFRLIEPITGDRLPLPGRTGY
jgi:hypothetical protein